MMKDKDNIDEILKPEDEHFLRRAAEVQFDKDMEEFDSFTKDGIEIPGLSDFDKRMTDKINMMYKNGRKYHRKKIIFKTLAVAAVVIFFTLISHHPLFGKVNAFFFRIMHLTEIDKGEYTEFRKKDLEANIIEEFEGYYYPRYIPDNYEIIVKNNMGKIGTIIYENKSDGTRIDYDFSALNIAMQLDTEDCIKEEILINNNMGLLYTKRDKSYNHIIFQNEEYNFVILGDVDAEILKKIAESIKK